jgi:hypothetical protein
MTETNTEPLKMPLNDSFVNEICHKMEDFILNEIDYSKENGYSGRARRFMKRKLNKELENFFNKRYKPDTFSDDSDDSELLIKRDKCNFCFGIMIMATMISFYTMFGFIIYRYQSCLVQQL